MQFEQTVIDPFSDFAYRGNKNIRPSGVKQEWTEEQVREYFKCKDNPIYFIQKYIKIVHIDKGVIPFELWDFQKKLILDLHHNRFTIGLWPRQSGKSTTIAAYMLHYVLFNENKNCAILANKAAGAREILGRIQMAYELLPFWLKQGVKDFNKGSLTLENGSTIIAAATSSSAIRGLTISFLLLDEFAFIPKNIAEDFFRSVYPTICSGITSKIAIISTPFGMNHYFKMWTEAEKKKNGYKPNRVFWKQVPGRDAKWKKHTISQIGEEAFLQEFDCEFLGSAGTLISSEKLKSLVYSDPIFQDPDGLRIFKEPEKEHSYIMTVDTSEGLMQDAHALSVFDVSQTPYNQVAVYSNKMLDPLLLPDVIKNIAVVYNEAHVLLELNSMGTEVAHILYMDLEYENIMFVTMSGRNGQILGGGVKGQTQYGLKTTAQSKRVSCSLLKSLIENDQLIVHDFETYQELTTFVRDKNTYNAEEGYNDDLVTTLRIFAWITGQQHFKDEMERDMRIDIDRNRVTHLEEMMTPFGIIDDGTDMSSVDVIDGDDMYTRLHQHYQSSNLW